MRYYCAYGATPDVQIRAENQKRVASTPRLRPLLGISTSRPRRRREDQSKRADAAADDSWAEAALSRYYVHGQSASWPHVNAAHPAEIV